MLSNKTRDKIRSHFGKNISVTDSIYQDDYEKDFTQESFIDSYVVESQRNIGYEDFGKLTGYRYLGDDILDNRDIKVNGHVSLFFYAINEQIFKPFITFVFEKHNNELKIPMIEVKNNTINEVHKIVRRIFSVFTKIDYQGFFKNDEELCLFYKIPTTAEAEFISSKEKYFRLCIHEIVNLQESYDTKVSSHAADFFINNEEFCYLEDEEYNLIEIPTVAYAGSYYKRIAITAALGIMRGSPFASMGPFFYFSSFKRAMRYAVMTSSGSPKTINGQPITVGDTPIFEKGGIVKFIIFTGKEKVFLNRDSDPDDTSEISKKMAENSDIIKATIKNRDNDSTWINDYDSTIITLKTIDFKGNKKVLEPQFTIKESEQTVPISYYYVDTKPVLDSAKTLDDGEIEYNFQKATII